MAHIPPPPECSRATPEGWLWRIRSPSTPVSAPVMQSPSTLPKMGINRSTPCFTDVCTPALKHSPSASIAAPEAPEGTPKGPFCPSICSRVIHSPAKSLAIEIGILCQQHTAPTPVSMPVMPEMSPIVCPLLPPLYSSPIEPRLHEVMQSTCPVLLITPPPCMTPSNGFPDAPSALALPKTVHKAPIMCFGGRGIPYMCCLHSFHCRHP